MTNEYEEQAQAFLKDTLTTMKVQYLYTAPHFPDDKESRDIYNITLTNTETKREYTFKFGDSIANTEKRRKTPPTAYGVLACLTSYDPGTFSDFCHSYGYDEDSRKAMDTYLAVQQEYDGISSIWNSDQLELLQEIN